MCTVYAWHCILNATICWKSWTTVILINSSHLKWSTVNLLHLISNWGFLTILPCEQSLKCKIEIWGLLKSFFTPLCVWFDSDRLNELLFLLNPLSHRLSCIKPGHQWVQSFMLPLGRLYSMADLTVRVFTWCLAGIYLPSWKGSHNHSWQ